MREKILSYRNIHAGEPICIIANGPSVLDMDWHRCPVATMGLNRAWQLKERTSCGDIYMRCDYYVMGDMGQFATFIRERGDLKRLDPLFTLAGGPDHAVRIPELHSKHRRISFDLTVGVYPNNTVTAFGIQLALWMGCNPIYIAGLDCKGAHFWGGSDVPDAAWANQREAMGYIAGFMDGLSEECDCCAAGKYCQNVSRIINLNPDSACTAFEFGELPRDYSSRWESQLHGDIGL